jgi:hypothetical protein
LPVELRRRDVRATGECERFRRTHRHRAGTARAFRRIPVVGELPRALLQSGETVAEYLRDMPIGNCAM